MDNASNPETLRQWIARLGEPGGTVGLGPAAVLLTSRLRLIQRGAAAEGPAAASTARLIVDRGI